MLRAVFRCRHAATLITLRACAIAALRAARRVEGATIEYRVMPSIFYCLMPRAHTQREMQPCQIHECTVGLPRHCMSPASRMRVAVATCSPSALRHDKASAPASYVIFMMPFCRYCCFRCAPLCSEKRCSSLRHVACRMKQR